MNISEFFIERPIFAAVVSTFITIAGALALIKLPVGEYPEVVPPSIVVTANYPGANPKVIADTVAAPLEQAIVGVDDMLYMSSTSTMNGTLSLTVTFKLGADVDRAQVQVQNRVAQAQPRLPQEVRDLGVTTVKSSSDLTMLVNLISPDNRYDALYLRNYATLNVRDVLARLPGMGQVQVFGGGDYAMRVWLDPEKLAVRNLTASDVITAIREQNVDVAAGQLGAPPSKGSEFQIALNAAGRLTTEDQFRAIIVKTGPNGELVRLGDLARVEMGAQDYGMRSMLNNQNSIALPIMQAPGANALQLSADVRRTMDELKKDFPAGLDYRIAYDPTQFVRQSIEAVLHTLLEAIALVVIVVIVFLQTWRASLIPLVAVPVSIIGTFAVLLAFGFSINTLSLFGLVLAIGIVVDDAIVVVENVERHIAAGEAPKQAARMAMREVSRPIIAITLVLVAVFGPVAFISGLTGEFYRQFALTIAISTVISAFNSLTLSPALAAVLLKPHGARPDLFARWMEQILGRFFRRFNKAFAAAGNGYSKALTLTIRRSGIALIIYAGLICLAWIGFNAVPGGFIPSQDKQYLIAVAQLPPAATIDRTEAVVRRMSEIGLKTPGVQDAVEFAGMSVNGWSQSSSSGIAFFALDPPAKRKGRNLTGNAIAARLNAELASIQDAYVVVFTPPPVLGLGSLGGFKAQVEDRGDAGPEALYAAVQDALGKAAKNPALAGLLSTYQINVPQLDVNVDRDKVMQQGVKLSDVFDTLQTYMGSSYVNDFNRFGRTFQVLAQADGPFRAQAEDIRTLKTRNADGAMVPLGSLLNVTPTFGPDAAQRYNAYRSADINAGPAPGYSTDQAQEALAGILKDNLPRGMTYEWTDLAYQQLISGNTATIIFPLCVLFVFLVLAAQYESLTLPLAIILIVPMCLLAGITGVYLDHGDNNVFTQIGLLVLVGLACKNAILIVEFAKHLQEDRGMDARAAVLEAAHLRLRPILMTSFAFIMGVIPLVLAQGSGAEVRHAMGVTVFAGMLGVTLLGLLLTPVFFVLIRRLTDRVSHAKAEKPERAPLSIGQDPEVHGA
jgi:hydrophobe/amphiphile efflux-1 (HAE1) family protein